MHFSKLVSDQELYLYDLDIIFNNLGGPLAILRVEFR